MLRCTAVNVSNTGSGIKQQSWFFSLRKIRGRTSIIKKANFHQLQVPKETKAKSMPQRQMYRKCESKARLLQPCNSTLS